VEHECHSRLGQLVYGRFHFADDRHRCSAFVLLRHVFRISVPHEGDVRLHRLYTVHRRTGLVRGGTGLALELSRDDLWWNSGNAVDVMCGGGVYCGQCKSF
jgi:hypothetical protein